MTITAGKIYTLIRTNCTVHVFAREIPSAYTSSKFGFSEQLQHIVDLIGSPVHPASIIKIPPPGYFLGDVVFFDEDGFMRQPPLDYRPLYNIDLSTEADIPTYNIQV